MGKYKYCAENPDIISGDYSAIENVYAEDEDLLLRIDFFLYNDKNRKDIFPCKHDCLLILKKFSLVNEQANASLISSKLRRECEKLAASKNLHLYLTFEEFLKTSVEVQSFDFEWGNRCLTITGYDSEEKNALWCSLKFRFHRILAYWNRETVW